MELETPPTLWERIVYAVRGEFPASWYRRDAAREAAEAEAWRERLDAMVASGRFAIATRKVTLDDWRHAIEERVAEQYRETV